MSWIAILPGLLGCGSGAEGGERTLQSLTETRWTLVELNESPVPELGEQQEPHIVLSGEGRRASGSSGCNRFTGSFELSGESLRLGPLAVTRRACAEGMEIEAGFLAALDAVARYRIGDGALELLSEDGEILARLEARRDR